MSSVFVDFLNLSIAASWLIAAVILVRFLLKGRAPSWVCCLLWGLVAVRLIIPFTVESNFSLVPNQKLVITDTVIETESEPMTEVSDGSIGVVPDNSIPYEQSYGEPDKETEISSDENVSENLNTDDEKDVSRLPVFAGDTDLNNTPPEGGNGVGGNVGTPNSSDSTDGAKGISERTASMLGWIWLAGFILMTGYATVSYVLLKIRVSTAIPCGGGVRKGERVDSPFVLGVFSPHIYLPMGLSEETENCVIAHERAHIKRFDHLIKPFGFFLLALYWFNPLVWVAYVLLCRDIENACDEKVINDLAPDDRKQYAKALLECAVSHKRIVACPVAFGETGVKERVKNTMSYKKPAFWIIICAVIICVAVAVFFMTTSSNGSDESSVPDSSNNESETESSDTESSNESEVSETESSDVSDESSTDESADGKVYHGLFKATEATDEEIAKLDNYLSFKSKKEYNTKPVIITPVKDITDFRIYEIECLDIATEDGLEYTVLETLYSAEKIEAGRPLVAELEMGEIIPVNAIAFTDSEGESHIFSFVESPVDGSLIFGSVDLAKDDENGNEPHTHSYGEWNTVLNPDCQNTGYKERVCACGASERETLNKTDHNYENNVCSVCGKNDSSVFIPDYSAGQANVVGAERGSDRACAQASWLYVADGAKISKINKNDYTSKSVYKVSSGDIFNLNVVGDWLYFYVSENNEKNSYIAKVRTDGSGFEKLLVSGTIWELLVVKDTIYYTPVKNGYVDYAKDAAPLYSMSVNGGSIKQIHDGVVVSLASDGAYLFYIYAPKTGEKRIYRTKISSMKKDELWINSECNYDANMNYFVLKNSKLYFFESDEDSGEYKLSSINSNGGGYTETGGTAPFYSEALHIVGNKAYYISILGVPCEDGVYAEEEGLIEYDMSTKYCKLLTRQLVFSDSAGGLIIYCESKTVSIYNPSTGSWKTVKI